MQLRKLGARIAPNPMGPIHPQEQEMHLPPRCVSPQAPRDARCPARSLLEQSRPAAGLSPQRTSTPASPAVSRADPGSQPSGRSLETRPRERSHPARQPLLSGLCPVTHPLLRSASRWRPAWPGPRPPAACAFGLFRFPVESVTPAKDGHRRGWQLLSVSQELIRTDSEKQN